MTPYRTIQLCPQIRTTTMVDAKYVKKQLERMFAKEKLKHCEVTVGEEGPTDFLVRIVLKNNKAKIVSIFEAVELVFHELQPTA